MARNRESPNSAARLHHQEQAPTYFVLPMMFWLELLSPKTRAYTEIDGYDQVLLSIDIDNKGVVSDLLERLPWLESANVQLDSARAFD